MTEIVFLSTGELSEWSVMHPHWSRVVSEDKIPLWVKTKQCITARQGQTDGDGIIWISLYDVCLSYLIKEQQKKQFHYQCLFQSQVPKGMWTKHGIWLINLLDRGGNKIRTSYLQQGITESVLLAYFAARRVLGPQRTPPTSSNPPHGIRMTSVMLSFPWGLWQLWKVGFSWHSMRSFFSVSPCQTVTVTEMNITAPIGSAEVLMAHCHMHFPLLLQVCSCDPFTVLFLSIQMANVEDTLASG